MKEKLKLKEWVKITIIFIITSLVFIGALVVYVNKIESIENGTITQINESYRDR